MKFFIRSMGLFVLFFSMASEAGVCERSKPVVSALERSIGKKCSEISDADLAGVETLALPHIHIKSFQDGDFVGLVNLVKLKFYSLLHNFGRPSDPIAIGDKVFSPLTKLEELIMAESLGLLPDDVFSGLVSLKILDLTDSVLMRLPSSLLKLPNIETVYFDGTGLSEKDQETLKTTLGAKLKDFR